MIHLTTQHVRSKFKHLALKDIRPQHLLRSAYLVVCAAVTEGWDFTHRGETVTGFLSAAYYRGATA
jgi:hypothetical protein